ncbi:MAG: lipopolysaccharide biosynthesis protein [Crenarchaeota archaeon]|nr:lipopolysaccharide biosynthesis protein [Thermoproteota archaeon]
MSLAKSTYTALLWSFIDRAGEQVLRFVFSIVLARLLLPADFGLLGMAYVVTEIARIIVQGGLGLGLINKKNTSIIDESSVFYVNLVLGFLGTVIVYSLAPVICSFYKNSAIIPIVRILSLNIVLGATGTIQTVLMTKKINFKTQTKVSISATSISGAIGIIMAFKNFGIWALVYQNLIRTAIYSLLMWFTYKWRPKIVFSLKSIIELFNFGYKILLGNLAQVIFNNIYVILIGRLFSPVQLGYFTRAQQTQQIPIDTMSTIIWRVTFPVMSTIKDDEVRFKSALRKAIKNLAFIVFPSMVICTIAAPTLFYILFGERWAPSVPMFQLLCIATIFLPIEQILQNSIMAKGKSGLLLGLQIEKYVTTIVSIIMTFKFGILGMLIGFGIISYANIMLNIYFVKREIGYNFQNLIADLFPSAVCTTASGLLAYALGATLPLNSILSLCIQIIAAAGTYIGLCYIIKLDVFFDNLSLVWTLVNKYRKNTVSESI